MIPVAPNRARIRALCEDVRAAPESGRKSLLRLRLEQVEVLHGGVFLRPGDQVEAFAFDLAPVPQAGATIGAEAEYLGGPRGGVVQLYDVRTL